MNRGIPHTDSPFTYVIDYGLHLNAPEAFIQEVAQAPPHLLHVAYDVLFHNRWGPFYQPRSSYEPPARLSPADVWERIALIRGYVDRLHQVGVNTVSSALGFSWTLQ